MYFKDRADAGRRLAEKLSPYQNRHCIVIALSKGAMIVGAQIAMKLHASLALYLVENITLPGETEAIGAMSSTGTFAYNSMLSPQEIEEAVSEFHGYIDQQRLEKMHHLNVLVGKDGVMDKKYIRRHVVILVSDGLSSGFSIKLAIDYLKTVSTSKIIIATPFATVPAVDSMHLLGDELQCLNVVYNFFGVDHYYEDNSIPPLEGLFAMMQNISLTWHQDDQTMADLDVLVGKSSAPKAHAADQPDQPHSPQTEVLKTAKPPGHEGHRSPNPPPTSGHKGEGTLYIRH